MSSLQSEVPRPRVPSVPSVRDLGKDLRPNAPFQPDNTEVMGSPNVPTTRSITAPHGTPAVNPLGLKQGSGTPLSAVRTPSPMAIVGGSSLRINSPDKPVVSRPAFGGSATTTAQSLVPMGPTPSAITPTSRPSLLQDLATASLAKPVPPTAPSSAPSAPPLARPATSPRSFAPAAGGPPASYERAFRQWSSPNIVEDSARGPVTFQVYTAQDVAQGRRPMRSLPPIEETAKKSNLVLRIGLSVVGALVVVLTAAAVIAVSTEDPKRPTPSATFTAPPPPPPAVEPAPSTISIGDPIDDVAPTTSVTPTPPTPKASPRPKPAAGAPAAPASLRGMAPPPNPYGK
jgi:hypothetical protein